MFIPLTPCTAPLDSQFTCLLKACHESDCFTAQLSVLRRQAEVHVWTAKRACKLPDTRSLLRAPLVQASCELLAGYPGRVCVL